MSTSIMIIYFQNSGLIHNYFYVYEIREKENKERIDNYTYCIWWCYLNAYFLNQLTNNCCLFCIKTISDSESVYNN